MIFLKKVTTNWFLWSACIDIHLNCGIDLSSVLIARKNKKTGEIFLKIFLRIETLSSWEQTESHTSYIKWRYKKSKIKQKNTENISVNLLNSMRPYVHRHSFPHCIVTYTSTADSCAYNKFDNKDSWYSDYIKGHI